MGRISQFIRRAYSLTLYSSSYPPCLRAVLKFRPWPELYCMCSALLTWVWVSLVPYGLTQWPLDSMLNLMSTITSCCHVCIPQDCTLLLRMLPTSASYPFWLPSPIPWCSSQHLLLPSRQLWPFPALHQHHLAWSIWLCTSFPPVTHGLRSASKFCRRTQPVYKSGHSPDSQTLQWKFVTVQGINTLLDVAKLCYLPVGLLSTN